MPAICRIAALALLESTPAMRPTMSMSLTIALLGGIAAIVAVRTMKGGQNVEDEDVRKKLDARSRWPWLGFVTGPGALQLTALLAGMLVASVSREFAWSAEMPPTPGNVIEWDADLAKSADVREISLANVEEISLVVTPAPKGTAANLLLVETGDHGGVTRNLKIAGGQPTSWRGEPSSTRLLVITRAAAPKTAPKVHFSLFLTSRDARRR
jgi:hypothetical protein